MPGAHEVTKVVTGVSAQLELFERAAEADAQLVVCHHGLFWDFQHARDHAGDEAAAAGLLDHDISLAAYHLPLDPHPEVGNNALICEALGLDRAEPFGAARGAAGRAGLAARTRASPFAELGERCREASARIPRLDAGPTSCTASGSSPARVVARWPRRSPGLDAFLTGEPAEQVMADAREAGSTSSPCGH